MEPTEADNNNNYNKEPLPENKKPNPKTDPLNRGWNTSLKDHKNPVIRGLARTSYTVYIIVMVVGLILAFIVGLFLV